MWVRFLVDHSYKPVPMQTTDYKTGMVDNLPHDRAEALIAAGKAEKVEGRGMPKRPGSGGKAEAKGEAES